MGSQDSNVSKITDFEHGKQAMEENDFDTAIDSFQKCMKRLSSEGHGLTSEIFPKCLQNISSCYDEKNDMDNALSFKKFEKLYYETVLLHNGLDGLLLKETEDEIEEGSTRDRGDGSSDASGNSTQVSSNGNNLNMEENSNNQTEKRASEYEQLARLCLQQECVSLSLEYSGKATILYRHQFGDDHEKTKKSFDFFTSVYAEAGKRQYSESMQQIDLESNSNISSPAAVEETLLRHRKNVSRRSEQSQIEENESSQIERRRSILKRTKSDEKMQERNGDAANNDNQRRVTFADPLPQMVRLRDDDESDNSTTNLLLFVLVCLLIILLSLLISAVFCHMNPKVGACVEFRREITYYYNKFRYLYRSFSR